MAACRPTRIGKLLDNRRFAFVEAALDRRFHDLANDFVFDEAMRDELGESSGTTHDGSFSCSTRLFAASISMFAFWAKNE
jgi:hypothetical protein